MFLTAVTVPLAFIFCSIWTRIGKTTTSNKWPKDSTGRSANCEPMIVACHVEVSQHVRRDFWCGDDMVASLGRLSLGKGEGEGFVSRQPVRTDKCEPLT